MATAARIFIALIFSLSALFFAWSVASMTDRDDNWKFRYMRERRLREVIKFDVARLEHDIEVEQGHSDPNNVGVFVEGLLHRATARMEEQRSLLADFIAAQREVYTTANSDRNKRLEDLQRISLEVHNFTATMKAFRDALAGFERRNAGMLDRYLDSVRQYEALAVEVARMQHEKQQLAQDSRTLEGAYFAAQRDTDDLIETLSYMIDQNPDLPKVAQDLGPHVVGVIERVSEEGVVSLSVGSNEGVMMRMLFSVFRDGALIARISVTDIRSNTAVAVVVRGYDNRPMRRFDRVERTSPFPSARRERNR